ncbi:methyl-accepting chemotaxis protein [Marinomonas sp. C2222]|uniref:Methyl-accepting chemotaxis protein n=1 Tax=Marinomonas sargassi TaxID=2984494 RepID=A0ABT2YRX3_9GAMM|nr:methyl-accepting chemotaxis protein [Marinomonas sargassi]MCV2402637.1 methyl-accepting chemotaxis protein [Marinomonas sargassi]
MFRSLKTQIYMFAFVPFILVAIAGIFMQIKTLDTINKDVSQLSENTIIEIEKRRLVTVLDSSASLIKPYLDMPGKKGMKDALALLYNYRFDKGVGYLFAYDGEGNRLMSGSDKGVGKNFINSKDKHGNLIVQNIINAAKSGEGFTTYYFPKKGETEPSAKYSYAIWIEQWGVAIATGFFIDGVEGMLSEIDTALEKSERESLIHNFLIILGISAVVAFAIFTSVKLMLTALYSLRDAVEDLADGEGDLTKSLPNSSLDILDDISQNFNRFLSSMSTDVETLKTACGQLNEIASVSRNQNKTLVNAASRQVQETTNTAAAIEEMSTTASEIAANAEHTRTSAENTDSEVQNVLKQVEVSGEVLNDLNRVLDNAEGSIQELGSNVEEINSVLSVIQGISEQTNLLALNAAIEAARAGELGRGFAVVADEVRNLAQRSQQSTVEIKNILEKLQLSADKTIQDMLNSAEKRTAVIESMDTISTIIHSSSESIKQLTAMNVDVSNTANQQSIVVNDMAKNISDIADIAESIGKGSEEATEQFTRLEEQSQLIQNVTNKFKT